MPKLTVFFVRSGETTAEVATANLRLHEMLDPPLTLKGYQQAQETFSALVQGLCDQTPVPVGRGDSDGDGVIDPLRNLACFSAPFRACQSTALLLSAANLGSQDKLTWRYTTVEAATSPSAVPVLTVNELAAAGSEITKCGGIQAVVDAGLLHAAAAPWNDTKNKCPFVRVCVRDMKRTAGDFVKTWKADRHVNPPRRVLDVQYLQLTDDTDPWSLTELTPKINVTIDMLEPKKYLPPPRKGNLECKLSSANRQRPDEEGPTMLVNTVESCVTKARQVGCDTIIFTVPGEVLQHMAKTAGGGGGGPMEACSVLTLTAVVHATGKSIDWTYVGLFTTGQLQSNLASAVPYFPGPVDCIVPPPEGKDPSSVPANQWSRFPPPEPEKIPDDYPDMYVCIARSVTGFRPVLVAMHAVFGKNK